MARNEPEPAPDPAPEPAQQPAPEPAPGGFSLHADLQGLSAAERIRAVDGLREADAEIYGTNWRDLARPEQLPPPGDWRVWLLLAGRGFGKTRSGAEWVRELVETDRVGRIALVGPTAAATRDVMIEGESGLLAIAPARHRPRYEPSKRRLTWQNGAIATAYSAEEPDRLRGPQHDAAWCDELSAWRQPAAWDMLMLGLRLGADPRAVVTTTPKPLKLLRGMLTDRRVAVTRGTTYDNRAHLAPGFLDAILCRYEGTRLGRQELLAELLEDVPGALWSRATIERAGIAVAPALARIVVAIDPAASAGAESDETGIIVAGLGRDGHGYVLDDLSGRFAPFEWARRAVAAYLGHGADRIVAEVNNGGDMVEATVRVIDPNASFRAVHATRGKAVRAEPVAALYEQGRVHHVGTLPVLEDEMCAFTGAVGAGAGPSPDRVDALVWALTDLMIAQSGAGILDYYRALFDERK
jgi:phage terminase large subunit-like protein